MRNAVTKARQFLVRMEFRLHTKLERARVSGKYIEKRIDKLLLYEIQILSKRLFHVPGSYHSN